MKPSVVILTILALAAAAGCGSTRAATKTVTVTRPAKSPTGRSRELAQFGYIKSLTRKGSGFELRFDPAWFLSGQTANTAHVCAPNAAMRIAARIASTTPTLCENGSAIAAPR